MSTTEPIGSRPPAAGSTAWHFVPRSSYPPVMEGTISLPGGSATFVHTAEVRAATPLRQKLDAQPAQFPFRRDWDHWQKPLVSAKPGSKEESCRLRIDECHNDRRSKIKNLGASPMDAWLPSPAGTAPKRYYKKDWVSFCVELSRLLDQKVKPRTRLDESAFITGLQFATYYASRDVLVASAALNCHENTVQNPPAGDPGHISAFEVGDSIPGGTFDDMKRQSRLGYLTNRSLQEAQFDKQFTVIPMHHNTGSGHWTLAVFDRRVGHLLYWDPLQPNATEHNYEQKLSAYNKRARTAIVAFKSYLTFNAQPNTFSFTVCSITAQRGSYECGHILCDVARHLFTGQTGLAHDEYVSMMKTSALGLPMEGSDGPRRGDEEQTTTDLRLRDWVAEPFRCDNSDIVYWEHFERMCNEWKIAVFGFLGSSDCMVEVPERNGTFPVKSLKALRTVRPYWLSSDFETNPVSLDEAAFPPLGGRAHSVVQNSIGETWWPYHRNFELHELDRQHLIRAGHARFQHPTRPLRYPEPVVEMSHAGSQFFSRRGLAFDRQGIMWARPSAAAGEEDGAPTGGQALTTTRAVSISSSNSGSAMARHTPNTAQAPLSAPAEHNAGAAATGSSRHTPHDDQLSNSISHMSLDVGNRPSSACGSLDGDLIDADMADAPADDSSAPGVVERLPGGGWSVNGALALSRLEMQHTMIEAGRRNIALTCQEETTRDMLQLSDQLGLMPLPGTSAQVVGSSRNTFVLEDMPSNLISHTRDWPRIIDYAYNHAASGMRRTR